MKLTVAGLQSSGSPGDVAANLRELDDAARTSASEGVDLLITPEMFVTGYDIGDSIYELAHADLVSQVAAIAARRGVALVAGLPEPGATGEIYNSAVFFDASGQVKARHHKTHLFGELDRKYFTPGSDAVTFVDHSGVRIGMMICYDVEFPENVRMSALAGVELLAVPTAQMQPFEFVADSVIRTRAWENQIYIAYVNHDGAEGGLVYVGRSSIVGPDAAVLDRLESGTGLIRAQIDTEVVREGQRRNPYLADLRPTLNDRLVQPGVEGVR